jgi:hypothetical protein
MTNRYTLAAVDPRLKAAAARLAQMLPPLKSKRRTTSRDR